jgi:outer membrane receptor protein involved in Fe transport
MAFRIVACALVSVLAAASLVSAQPAVSTLRGNVTDQQGAVLPSVTITVRSRATNASWTATSDKEGRFTIPLLPPGDYEVTARGGAALAEWHRNTITLNVGQDRVLEVRMALAGVRETTIVGSSYDISQATSAVSTHISDSQIEALPLNGRNFLELALLAPGSQPTPTFDPTKTNSVLISSAGQLGRGSNITIDGQDTNDDVVGGPLLNLPIDAVAAFQVDTNGFGADLGRSASSVMNVVTRSGANTASGSAAFFARDDGWQALPATADRSAGTPPFDRQQMSVSYGGPLRRDRLFFFGAMEYRNQDGAVQVGSRNTTTRTIDRSFATAPLDDSLWLARVDSGGTKNRFTVRYAGEHAKDTAASALDRAIGSATQRQQAMNRYHSVYGTWTTTPSATFVNALHVGTVTFINKTDPVATAPQLTFPSLQDGASFRMPQETHQTRFEISDNASFTRGAHNVSVGGAFQRIDGEFRLGVFQQGRIEFVEDFPSFDHNGDGRVDDNDLLFAITLRSGKPDQELIIPDADNMHIAGFAQDDWLVSNNLRIQAGLRYEVDTDVNNMSHVDELNPIVLPFANLPRKRDLNNLSPRIGASWRLNDRTVLAGGYGIYYDRIVLEIVSLERGLDGRALPIEVKAGNTFFLDSTGHFPPFAPSISNPFTGFVLPGAGASGINIIDAHLQNPMVHEFHLSVEHAVGHGFVRADGLHNVGRHFIIGRTVGQVFNPVVGGPDRVVNIESSARTAYDGLLLSVDQRIGMKARINVGYTLSKQFNYANDDQIPFQNGPIDPNDPAREEGPTPNDRRHRLTMTAQIQVPFGIQLAGIWTQSSGVPMDILMPDSSTRVPVWQRNAGGRQFKTASELNAALTQLNAGGGIQGVPLPLVSDNAKFNDSSSSVDIRISRPFAINQRVRIEPMAELFNVLNTTNILGTGVGAYSGYSNVLVRDSNDPSSPGFLHSSSFGRPVTTAGGVFGSGGPRALQLSARVTF